MDTSPSAGPSPSDSTASPGPHPRVGLYHLFALLGVLPIVALAVYSYVVSERTVRRLADAGNDATATLTGALVGREFEQWNRTLTGIAGFPTLRASVAAGDVDEVRRRLRIFVEAHPRLDRAFITDTTGLLWADHPVAPESLGRRFDDRDWFRGVSTTGGPYVSEVYRRNARPQLLVVAVAVPVRDPATEVTSGYLVVQVRLDGLTELLRRIEVGGEEGIVFLLDHTGAVVAHPNLDLQRRIYREYVDTTAAAPDRAPRFGSGPLGDTDLLVVSRGEYRDPFTGEEVVASALPIAVGGHVWTVISQQPLRVALAPSRALGTRLAAAGVILTLVLGGFFWGLGRENARRRRAEDSLEAANQDLERRVEERTEELRQKEEELLQIQKMEAVGQLAGGVAHDFNNLLTVILANTEMVLESLPDGSRERQDLEQVYEASSRAEDLTRQLLAFSRKQVLQPEVLDVNEAVERMWGILDRILGEDIEIERRLASGLHPVKFDPGKIEQVIMNLAVNAREAMPRGGMLTISTENVLLDDDYVEAHPEARAGPHVVLAVTDTGKGMDAETRKRIFEPFFTTKARGTGTGLGLATVHGIVRQGGGNIWVYSEPGMGTTFKVYLPRTDDAPAAEGEKDEWKGQAGSGVLVVVEDDDSVRSVAVRILESAGYEVLAARDAATARSIFRREGSRVDLLVTDVILPDLPGPAIAGEIRTEHPDLAVLFMSGYTDDALVQNRVLEQGAAFLEKPFRPRELLSKVWVVLSQARRAG